MALQNSQFTPKSSLFQFRRYKLIFHWFIFKIHLRVVIFFGSSKQESSCRSKVEKLCRSKVAFAKTQPTFHPGPDHPYAVIRRWHNGLLTNENEGENNLNDNVKNEHSAKCLLKRYHWSLICSIKKSVPLHPVIFHPGLPFFLSCGVSDSVGSDTERTLRLTGENRSTYRQSLVLLEK